MGFKKSSWIIINKKVKEIYKHYQGGKTFKMVGKTREGERIDFKYNFRIYGSLLKHYKFILAVLFILIVLHESKQVAVKYLLKIIIDDGTKFNNGLLTYGAFVDILWIIAGAFAFFTFMSVFLNWGKLHFLNRLDSGLMADLRRKFFNHLVELDHNFHTSHKTGSLISRITRGSSAIERMTDVFVFNFAPPFVQLIVVIFSILYFDWISALVVSLTAVFFIIFSFYVQRKQEESNIIANKTEDIEKGNIADIFTNIDSIKYFGKEKSIKSKYFKLSENTKVAFLKNWDYIRWLSGGQSLIIGIGTFFLMYFSIWKFLNGGMTLGAVAFIYTIFFSFIGQMFGFVSGIRNYYRAMADFQELFKYNKIEKDIKDKSDARKLFIEYGTIEFKDVEFKYGRRKIFEEFNLNIKKNEKVALVGHSGCGKTTLIKILYRLYDVSKGKVLVDGKDVRSLKQESLREEMSIVPQECILFDDTIYNNIKFANPSASRDQVMAAIKFAQMDKIITNFPDKEKTIVGERGVKLSGGEKQRVSIARAILANKKILVLDEATSSLDSETEYEIQRDLQKLLKGRTSIIIAHRLSTIMNADRIIVMKNGKIIQEGNHFELISKVGEYKKLWNLQKGGYIR